MKKALAAVFLMSILLLSGMPFIHAQDHIGTIQGMVTDKSGSPMAGATVYLSSPAILGMQRVLTGKSGKFDFPALAPGTYRITVEMPGYQTVVRDRIILRTGMAFFFPIELAPSEQEIEVVAQDSSSVLDSISSKAAVVRDQALIGSVPLARDFGNVLNTAPGAISPGYAFDNVVAMHGGTVRNDSYVLDGVNLTDVLTGAPLSNLNVDMIEEIEIISAGQPSSHLPGSGAYVNIVSKSGGNAFSGELGFHFINDGWNKDLWTLSQMTDLGTGVPAGEKNLFEPSLSLGGPFWTDRAWFFLAGRYLRKSMANIFISPFMDVLGRKHDSYDWYRKDTSGFFKLILRPISDAKFTTWVNLAGVYQPVSEDPSPHLPFISTHVLDHQNFFALHGVLDYTLSQNAQAYARAAYVNRNSSNLLQREASDLAWTDDAGDLYGPLSGADYNSISKRQRIQADASLRVFADDFLGASHTVTIGAEFDQSTSNLDWWRKDNLLWFLDSRNPDNSFYRDRGRLGFWICGSAEESTLLSGQTQRLGVYVTDSFSIAGRMTFSLGLRFERAWSRLPSGSKNMSGNPLSLFVGDALVSPYVSAIYPDDFPQGFNPWDALTVQEQKDVLSWNVLSPRAGFAFDILGNGKTILKASYARYADDLSHRYILPLNFLYPQNISVYWMDANADGQPDAEDEFSLENLDFRFLSGSFFNKRVASGIKAPSSEEISAGIDQELFKNFTLGLRFIYKKQTNILEDVLYAPDTGEYWYSPDQAAAKKYWIPFTTTVPGTDSYPSQTVTFYTKSLKAPAVFLQLRNVPELERKYQAMEFTFHKRMAQGWQLAGSLVLSKTEGNLGGFADETTAFTAAANSANFFINRYGRLDTDRPVQIKIMASWELPFRIGLSAFYHYQSGRPWQRWAQVLPPAAWCSINNAERVLYAVNLETRGTQREKTWSSLDLRLEKNLPVGKSGKFALYADVTNLLGFTASIAGLNDIDRWEPAAEGAGQAGTKYLHPDYKVTSTLIGKRTIRFGFKLNF